MQFGMFLVLPDVSFGEREVVFLIAAQRAFCLVIHLQIILLHQRRHIDAKVILLFHNFISSIKLDMG